MAEKIGLIADIDMGPFNKGFSQYTSSLSTMNSKTASTASALTGGFLSMGGAVNSVALAMGKGLIIAAAAATAAVGAFVVNGVKGAIALEAQIDNIAAVMGEGSEATSELQNLIFDLGVNPNLKVTATEAADAIELLARNGLTMTEILGGAAEATVLLANATGADFGTAADIATDAMAIFGREATEMVDIVGAITAVTNNSKFTIDDYNLALRNGGATANQAGVSLEEFNTVVTLVAEEMGSGQKAGTGFRNFLNRLTPSGKKATETMRELGLITADGTNQFFDSNGVMKSTSEVIKVLDNAMNGTAVTMSEVGGRTAAQNKSLTELRKAYTKAEDNIRSYTSGVKGANLSDSERNDKIAEQREAMASLSGSMEPLLAIRGEMISTTSTLTEMEKSMALEILFGADASQLALGLMKEAKPAYTDVATAMEELGISQAAATRMVEKGTTGFEMMLDQIEKFDAVAQARQKMDNLAGTLEIIAGIAETVGLQIGTALLPVLQLAADAMLDIADKVAPIVVDGFQKIAGGIDMFVDLLSKGQTPMTAFTLALLDMGVPTSVISDIQSVVRAIRNFITTISTFVNEHKDAFIGAIKGIGAVLAASSIVSAVLAIGGVLLGLLNPITFIIGLAALLGAAWQTNFGGLADFTASIWTSIQTAFLAFQSFFTGDTQGFLDGMESAWFSGWAAVAELVGNLWRMIQPHLQTLFKAISKWVKAQDWKGIGLTIIRFISNKLKEFSAFVTPILSGWWKTFSDWFNAQDWRALATLALLAIIEKLADFSARVSPILNTWWITFGSWFVGQDWKQLGLNIINPILAELTTFGEFISPTLVSWWNAFVEWFATQPWTELPQMLFDGITTKLATFGEFVSPILATWWTTFSEWFATQDWASLILTALQVIGLILIAYPATIIAFLQPWYTAFVEWFGAQDWTAIIWIALQFIVTALHGFVVFILEILFTWWTTFFNWAIGQDWMSIGQTIIDFILEALMLFPTLIVETLVSWFQAFRTWVDDTDWFQVGFDVVTFIITGLRKFKEEVLEPLGEWFTTVKDKIDNFDWEQIGKAVVLFFLLGFASFALLVGAKVTEWYNATKDAATGQNWGDVGKNIVRGIIVGLASMANALSDAVSSMMSGAVAAAMAAIRSDSPSKVFADIGGFMGEGLVIGIDDSASKVAKSAVDGLAMPAIDGTVEALKSPLANIGDVLSSSPLTDVGLGAFSPTFPSSLDGVLPPSKTPVGGDTFITETNDKVFQMSVNSQESTGSLQQDFRLMEMLGV
jgi:TP901 family phage tail tape measure protein